LRCASPPVIHEGVPAGLRIKTYPYYYQHKNVKKKQARGKKNKNSTDRLPLFHIFWDSLLVKGRCFLLKVCLPDIDQTATPKIPK
jgi:hypothetical protein